MILFSLNSRYINLLVNQKIILKRVVELYGLRGCSKDDVARPCGKTLYGFFANKYLLIEAFVACLTRWFSASDMELITGKIFQGIEEGLYVNDLDNIHGMLHKSAFLRVNSIRPPDITSRL